jgi:putative copper resistance protein D
VLPALLEIFGFLSVVLRGVSLCAEALVTGGVCFLFYVGPGRADFHPVAARLVRIACAVLFTSQITYLTFNSAILAKSLDLPVTALASAGYFAASLLSAGGAILVAAAIGQTRRRWPAILGCCLVVAGAILVSHSAARLDRRLPLAALTAIHHIAGGAWIGGLPYLLLFLRNTPEYSPSALVVARFSQLAAGSAASLLGAGVALAFFYIHQITALTGTAYGIMVLNKAVLTSAALVLGAMNRKIVQSIRSGVFVDLHALQRFCEVEIAIGFTVLLAAASLTSAPPAADVVACRVTLAEIVERNRLTWPRLQTPAPRELSPARILGSVDPGPVRTPADRAWSEYNHHWAGIIVFAAGLFALASRIYRWATHWPLAFLGLGVFLFLRADAAYWPLGPSGLWESFWVAEVAQHRLFVVLISAYAIFEWRVQTGYSRNRYASYALPLLSAIGAPILLMHSHSLGNVKEEFLAELSHAPIAILGLMAGCSRWLELRLTKGQHWAWRWAWPVCLMAVGFLLVMYRES